MGTPKQRKFRSPNQYPKNLSWKLEGCDELLEKLSAEDKAFYGNFLESIYGGNPPPNSTQDEKRAIWREAKRSQRDTLNTVSPNQLAPLTDIESLDADSPEDALNEALDIKSSITQRRDRRLSCKLCRGRMSFFDDETFPNIARCNDCGFRKRIRPKAKPGL